MKKTSTLQIDFPFSVNEFQKRARRRVVRLRNRTGQRQMPSHLAVRNILGFAAAYQQYDSMLPKPVELLVN